jgi:hypothetical protein
MEKKVIIKTSAKSAKAHVFRIEKDFSINNVVNIKSEILEILKTYDQFTLELKSIENFDLTSLQILYSLKLKMKEKLIIKYDLKEDIENIVINSGFDLN